MANLYTPQELGITVPANLSGNGNWIQGRQIWDGKLSDPGVINPLSNQTGAGKEVSKEVNAQSAAAQGVSPQQLESYLQQQRDQQAKAGIQPSSNATPTPSTSPDGSGAGVGYTAPTATLNLPDLYKSLYDSQGISELETGLNTKAKAYADAQSKINDNPFLSEASRTGRIQKLTNDYNASVKNDQDLLAMKKQDIATQLDIATKQFDIDSATAKQALDQFNTLLASGALAGASGNDIAAITKATGISSSMIQAAINAEKDKNVSTSVSTVDDGTNVYSVVINSKTGALISKQVIAASKPSTTKATESEKTTYYSNSLRSDAQNGMTLSQIFSLYTGYLDPNTILYLYNANSKYGPAKESMDQLAAYGVKDTSKMSSTDLLLQKLSGN